MKFIACAVLTLFLATMMVQAAKKTEPKKFCLGENGIKYGIKEGYKEGCTKFICVKRGNQMKMFSKPTTNCGSNSTPTNTTPEIEANLAENVTALETTFQILQESVLSLQTSMNSMVGMIATFESTSSKLESCLADISSSDCPQPASGKTSVAEGISGNTDAFSGISSSNAALAAKDIQIESCLADISSSDCPQPASGKTSVAEGISSNTDTISGISLSNAALAAKDIQIESCLADISSSDCPQPASGKTSVAEGISGNTDAISEISSSNAALAAKDIQIENCLADISSETCPPPASGKTSVVGGISANTAALDDKCDASTCSDIQETIQQYQPKFNLAVCAGSKRSSGTYSATSVIIGPEGVCSQDIPPLPLVLGAAQSVYFSETLMVCGGSTSYVDNTQKNCYQLRDSNSDWIDGPAMNVPRRYFSLTKAGQDVYAMGGRYTPSSGSNIDLDSMEKLSESSEEWTLMDKKLTSPRISHCTVFIETNKSLVTMGGLPYTDLVEEFSLETSTWKQLAPLPVQVYAHGCAVLGQTIVVTGGYISGGPVQNKVYTFLGGIWEMTGELEQARYYHTMGKLDDKLLILGGRDVNYDYLDSMEEMQEDGSFGIMPWKLATKQAYSAIAPVPRKMFPCL